MAVGAGSHPALAGEVDLCGNLLENWEFSCEGWEAIPHGSTTFESALSVPDSAVAYFYPPAEEDSFHTKKALPNKPLEEDHDH